MHTIRGTALGGVVAALCLTLVACEKKDPPRSYNFFMEDRIAREGTLLRCENNPAESLNDIECANAERAVLELDLIAERERAAKLERESELRMQQLREQMAERDRRAQEERIEALRQEIEAYEAMVRRQTGDAQREIEGTADEAPGDILGLNDLPESVPGEETASQ